AAGLHVGHRGNTELTDESAPQVTVADTQLPCQLHQAAFRQAILAARGRLACRPATGIPAGEPRRALRPATQTGAEALRRGRRRAGEKAAVGTARQARRTDRAAVHAGGGHRYEEATIEAVIAGAQGLITNIVVDPHEAILA